MSNTINKVVRFHETGDASVLKIEDLPIAEPAEQEVRIKVEAIGLNRAEIMFRNGQYLEAPECPSRLGYEAAGIVEALGAGVSDFEVGDRVSTVPAFSMGRYGIYAEHAIVPTHALIKCPANFSAQQSAAIWMQYTTAYGALVEYGQLSKDQYVLITAASSSVGVAAIQLAKQLGAKVIATTRGESKQSFLQDQGADHVILTDSQDLVAVVNEVTQAQGVDLVFDPIGGPVLSQLADATRQGGLIIEYGALDERATPYPLFTALGKGLTIRGYTLFEISQDPSKLAKAKAFLLPLFEAGKLTPAIDKVFSFDQIQQAHEYMESNQQMGKIVVSV